MIQSHFDEPIKACFKCQIEQPLSMFYRHKKMGDGHLNKCKTCTKKDVARHYASNLHQASAYEKQRSASPARRAKALEYQRLARWRHPDKDRARRMVNHHLRAGTLQKRPCEVCGVETVEAHHRDYTKPLEVAWLCRVHHRLEHAAILPERVALTMRQ